MKITAFGMKQISLREGGPDGHKLREFKSKFEWLLTLEKHFFFYFGVFKAWKVSNQVCPVITTESTEWNHIYSQCFKECAVVSPRQRI